MILGPKHVDPSRIVLVNPTTDSEEAAASAACYPPLGLISLGTTLKSELGDLEVKILDQAALGVDTIVKEFTRGSVVGISALTTTYRNALRFAQEAIDNGCFVVLGNDHSSRFADLIVRDRGVHAVLIGDHAEFPLVDLIRWAASDRNDIPEIPGLVMMGTSGPVTQRPVRYPMERVPIPDRSLLDHQPYREEFLQRFGLTLSSSNLTPTTVNLCRGCSKVNDRCSFCDIYDLSLDRVSPKRAWEELLCLTRGGFNYLWEVGDSFTSHPHWLAELAATRPTEFKGELFVYARAQELTKPNTVGLLAQIGVSRVNVGMESGDDDALRVFNKGNLKGSETNRIAARNLAERNIRAHVSLILGVPGESYDSLARTEDLVQTLLDLKILSSIDVAILYPLPGAPLWNLILEHPCFRDAVGTDLLPPDLRERFIKHFCSTSIEVLHDTQHRINEELRSHGCVPGGFG
jgi:anaerobic magnesium-protoporphyrin IX monomethyl ester cyclase